MNTLVAAPPASRVADSGSAVSKEAQAGRLATSAVEEEQERSFALFGRKAAAISEIWALVFECDEANWDGEDAEPISDIAAHTASDFIRALPDDVRLPESAPEPDGSISLDWIESRNRVFSLSVGSRRRLPYAWVDGADNGHGVAYFDGVTIPPRILDGIRRAVEHGDSAVRPR